MANISNLFSRLFRSAFRNKGLTIINIIGLTLAIAVALFLTSYLKYEFSFDKDFKDADRIYRVLSGYTDQEDESITETMPINLGALSQRLVDEVPEIQYASRLYDRGSSNIKQADGDLIPLNVYEVDSSFVNIFSFDIISGDAYSALKKPGTCVLTRSSADKLFGTGSDPLDKQIDWGGSKIVVAAIIQDLPPNTHLDFDVLIPMVNIWPSIEYFIYYKLHPNADAKSAITKTEEINNFLLAEWLQSFSGYNFFTIVEPLTSVHSLTKAQWDLTPSVNRNNLILILLITLLILVIAIINFTSLYILQGENRSKEISVKKINGAERKNIVRSLIGEITLITSISFVVGIILYVIFARQVMNWTGLNIPMFKGFDSQLWGYFILIFLAIILLSSLYPAQYLSRISASQLMQGGRRRKFRMTVWSVVVQFSIVIFALSSLLVVGKQMKYVHNLPLGFTPDNILITNPGMRGADGFNTLKSKLLQYPEIQEVAASRGAVINDFSGQGIRLMGQAEDANIGVDEKRVGPGFLDIHQIPIIEGSNFSETPEFDRWNLILSESLVKALGLEDPIGKKVMFISTEPYTVIGVAKDIHYSSAHKKIGYLVYSAYNTYYYTLSVRFAEGKHEEAKRAVMGVLNEVYPGVPFDTSLISDLVQKQYEKDNVTYRLLIGGTIIAIIVSLLGLLALSGFVARQKQKEVSVRRVYGAQVDEAIMSLNYFILWRILPAIPIGIVASWFLMKKWLANFAYSIHLSWTIFLLAVVITLLLALITTLFHSIKAATSNPAKVLKSNE